MGTYRSMRLHRRERGRARGGRGTERDRESRRKGAGVADEVLTHGVWMDVHG